MIICPICRKEFPDNKENVIPEHYNEPYEDEELWEAFCPGSYLDVSPNEDVDLTI